MMIEEQTTAGIIGNLKLLTLKGKILWYNTNGVFATEYLGDFYGISINAFTINNSHIGFLLFDAILRDFYIFLNDLVVGRVVLDKLNTACEAEFLGTGD